MRIRFTNNVFRRYKTFQDKLTTKSCIYFLDEQNEKLNIKRTYW